MPQSLFQDILHLTLGLCQGSFLLPAGEAKLTLPAINHAAPSGRRRGLPRRHASAPQKPARATTQIGDFIEGMHTNVWGNLGYKLFVPSHPPRKDKVLVVMLHGCSQDPDDFAAGTGMNALAQEKGFHVLYPEAPDGGQARCWNWFNPDHQQRGAGEPALIAGLTQAVVQGYGIHPGRVYVAGLSAGGAMAATMASAYPDLYAAAGVHSGLPHGVAHDVGDALSLMFTGRQANSARPLKHSSHKGVPTIVFHGDQDRTVHPRNGEQLIDAALADLDAAVHSADAIAASALDLCEQCPAYTRSTFTDTQGAVVAEHWLVHGAGHAWSGGSAEGSYTETRGPDATREMVRFFMAHPHR